MSHDNLTIRNEADHSLALWHEWEKKALKLLKIAGELRFNHSVELVLFRRHIYNSKTSTILNNHKISRRFTKRPVNINRTLELAKAIAATPNMAPSKIDLGTLAVEWVDHQGQYGDLADFVQKKIGHIAGAAPQNDASKDVVLYGFGRIGRLAARILINSTGKGDQLRLKAIVIRPKMADRYEEALKRAALLQTDSVHGDFGGTIDVEADGSELIVNGNRIKLIYAGKPSEVDYTAYGINNALVIDNTGVWRDREGLGQHLACPGVAQALLTAPAKGDIPNIVYGVNQLEVDIDEETIFSAASCTTNAVAPVLKVMMDKKGVEKGHIETIHAYTNDQNLLDNFHKKPRRGRGAPVNMVLTTTGAASAVTKVMPAFKDKLTGNAIRVPTPNVSMAILNLTLEQTTTREELKNILKDAASHGDLVEQIRYSNSTEFVSSNAIGMTTTSVVDAPSTIVSKDGKNATIYLWYDNEFGYTCQVVRLAKHIAKVRRYVVV